MSERDETSRRQLGVSHLQWLEPEEKLVAGAGAMTGSQVWGPTSMLAKWCYIGVTDRRVVVLSLAR